MPNPENLIWNSVVGPILRKVRILVILGQNLTGFWPSFELLSFLDYFFLKKHGNFLKILDQKTFFLNLSCVQVLFAWFQYYDEEEPLPDNVTMGYMIATPEIVDKNSPKRVCFVYMFWNETYHWSVDITSCPRNIRPGMYGKFRFNTTKLGKLGGILEPIIWSLVIVLNDGVTFRVLFSLLLRHHRCRRLLAAG